MTAQAQPKSFDVRLPARDGFQLSTTQYHPGESTGRVAVINSATAVPRRFYRHFAAALAARGYHVVTYDYRGTGGSRPESLRGFQATMRDWAFQDMAGVIDWVSDELAPSQLCLIGHSFGGQAAGLLDNHHHVDAMLTLSSQSGYWRHQGGEQKWVVAMHVYLNLPLLAHIMGHMPWRWFGGEDLPKGVALEWARWCRDPRYLLGDDSLPLERYQGFEAPVLAYSIADDKWGTPRAVDAMMSAYPNLERRHLDGAEAGIRKVGHMGFFRPASEPLWDEPLSWLDATLC
ncbi:MAG: alpha/beta fold hydrolase [Pseudomonadota bacterium]